MSGIILSRDFAGIGDWLMALHCMKLVNQQRPDIDIYVDFETRREPMPEFIVQAWKASDVRYRTVFPAPLDARPTGHLVYRRVREGFMPSMLTQINARCGLDIRYGEDWPHFGLSGSARGHYVCTIGHGKAGAQNGKDPGFEYFDELAGLLQQHVRVVQLGAADDHRLVGADTSLLGAPFPLVAQALLNCGGFIGIENGLMILSGFLGIRQITIYNGRGSPERIAFQHQHKVIQPQTPEEICRLTLKAF